MQSGPITKGVIGFLEEGEEQAAHDFFGNELGRAQADRLMKLWKDTHSVAISDRLWASLRGQPITKEDRFRVRASKQGFSSDAIEALLSLQ